MPIPLGAEPALPPLSLSTSLNGTNEDALERWKCRELMEGFPAHRDACEWTKMRALFAEKDAYVFTTWSGGVPIDEFIKISEIGYGKGVKIAHRVNGGTVDVAVSGPYAGKRALGKLKATITQRFIMDSTTEGEKCEVDIEADCRLCFFMEKHNGEWKNHFFKGFYEKDKAIPVDPRKIPKFDEAKLASYPAGYRYLAYGQSAAYKIKLDLPQNEGEEHDQFYEAFISWLEGTDIEKMKVLLGV
ncbi:catabolic 3-dehydroquinase [Cystobasidium minutum MCA 4210]|uniref:catabolic 3-dehydroquinase n=1 Tax=Cystobasidium minutum MCA 4210 TaxID=1397322 RepID=UPI0034D007F5|eukprot:jgi/Rhomi1/65185/CE65184_542